MSLLFKPLLYVFAGILGWEWLNNRAQDETAGEKISGKLVWAGAAVLALFLWLKMKGGRGWNS